MPRRKLPPLKPLTEQQKKAVQMTYDNQSVQEIADALKVHRTTIWRWKRTREFWADWHRIDKNWRRKYKRREEKHRAQEEARWTAEQQKWEKKLSEAGEKENERPGKAWHEAYNNYMRACLQGQSWPDIMRWISTGEYKLPKRRRRK